MTTSQDTMNEVTHRSQEAITSAVKIWADSLEKFVGLMPAPEAKVPSADEVVDNWFNCGAQALAAQRECTKSLLAVIRLASTNAAWAARVPSRKGAETAPGSR